MRIERRIAIATCCIALLGMLAANNAWGQPYDWSLQAKSAYAEGFGRFDRLDTGLQWEGSHRFGVDAECGYWRDSVAPEQNRDFWTGDANVVFRFAQSEWLQTRVGLGVAWLDDDSTTDSGFNFTYKADIFV